MRTIGIDEDGRPVTEITRIRRYKVDLGKQGLLAKKVEALRGLLRSKPLVPIEAIEDKELPTEEAGE